eukprot:92277-Pyramimonas_sp.AAC.1
MVYLGATLSNSAQLRGELGKESGAAWGEFYRHIRAWKHAATSATRKLQLFHALVTRKVMYSLNSAWLNKADRERLD